MHTIRYDDVPVGYELPQHSFRLSRLSLIRYAGASGDFNVIHWNKRAARAVGLPDVVAHGMLTMAEAIRIVTNWVGDPGAVLSVRVRFTRPVIVPDDDHGALVQVAGNVVDRHGDNVVGAQLTAVCAGEQVLGRAHVLVRLA